MRAGFIATIACCTLFTTHFARAMEPSANSAAAPHERFAALALKCLHQEYPNKISHTMSTDADARPPRELTPAFYGCYDWHSDVHGHWLLVRLLRLHPNASFAQAARIELAKSFTPENIAAEVKYLERPDRASFERVRGEGQPVVKLNRLRINTRGL